MVGCFRILQLDAEQACASNWSFRTCSTLAADVCVWEEENEEKFGHIWKNVPA